MTDKQKEYKIVDINKDEYKYLNDNIRDIHIKLRKKRREYMLDDISNRIDPEKIASNKYNL